MISLKSKRIMVVAFAALSFRILFILWGLSDWHVINQRNTLSSNYIFKGYGLCAGYGYVSDLNKDWAPFVELEKIASTTRITPENAPKLKADEVMLEMHHPPGTSFVVALLHELFGTRADMPLEIFGAVLDTIAACLIYYMIATYYHPTVGFVTGLIYAFYPPIAYASTVYLLPDGLTTAFVVGCLLCVVISAHSKGFRSYMWCSLAGSLLGMSAYFRPDYLLMPLVVGIACWVYTHKFWESFFRLITVQAVAIALLLPWAYRNYEICGRWIFTSSATGPTLVTGLGTYNNPWNFGGLDEHRYAEAKAQGFKSPWSPEADQYFRKLFWESVKSHPMGYVMTVIKRLPMGIIAPHVTGYKNPYKTKTFSQSLVQGKDRYEIIKNEPIYVLKAYWDILLISLFNLICVFCTIFMVFKGRKSIGIILLLLSPHIYSLGTHLLTHMEPRYMLPSMFSLFFGLAYVLCRAWRDEPVTQTII
jgi:hypothetical protein